jgi:hypothetical protein
VPKARYRLELPDDLRDEEARPLAPIDPQRLEIAMAAMPPLAKFSGTFGILEVADPVLPVAIRGLEAEALPKGVSVRSEAATAAVGAPSGKQIWAWLRATTDDPRYRGPDETGTVRSPGDRSLFERAAGRGEVVPAPKPLALPRSARPEASEAELIGIPLAGLGLHAIDIESRVLGESLTGKGATYHASALALVTNLSVHFKHGRQGSLAWVTSLDRGEPVEATRVAVFDCQGAELAAATTDEDASRVSRACRRTRKPGTRRRNAAGATTSAACSSGPSRAPTSPSSTRAGIEASSPGASICRSVGRRRRRSPIRSSTARSSAPARRCT